MPGYAPAWTEEEDNILKQYYQSTKFQDIHNLYLPNRTLSAITARSASLKLHKEKKIIRRLYSFNEEYFSIPAIENSYWAGYIAADGHLVVHPDRIGIRLRCQKRDEELLTNFKNCVNSNHKITYYQPNKDQIFPDGKKHNVQECACLIIYCCQKWIDDLNKYWNITPKKSLTLQPPNTIENEFNLAYICGYFDGDGFINQSHTAPNAIHKTFQMGFYSTYDVVTWIREQIKDNLPELSWNDSVGKAIGCYKIAYACRKARIIHNMLNTKVNIPFKLKRKWNIDYFVK